MTETESPAPERPLGRMTWLFLWLPVVLPILGILAVLAWRVDDWSRDLTTNRAHTAPGERNLPWVIRGVTLEQIATATETLGQGYGNWRLANEKPLPDDSPLPEVIGKPSLATYHFVRTTGLMGFKDDVWLLATLDDESDPLLYAESRSRVGKGDLGQNRRNLMELQFYLGTALGD